MAEFKFKLGEIVCLDPTGKGRGMIGKVVARTECIDGSIEYRVSGSSFGVDAIVRHIVMEYEIQLYSEKPANG